MDLDAAFDDDQTAALAELESASIDDVLARSRKNEHRSEEHTAELHTQGRSS